MSCSERTPKISRGQQPGNACCWREAQLLPGVPEAVRSSSRLCQSRARATENTATQASPGARSLSLQLCSCPAPEQAETGITELI